MSIKKIKPFSPHSLPHRSNFFLYNYINILKNILSFCTVFSPRSKKIVCLLILNKGLDGLE